MSTTIISAPQQDVLRRGRLDHVATGVALVGAGLGVLVGLAEITVGPFIREWFGNKQDTTRLGLATLILSCVALTAATVLRQIEGRANDHRLAITAALWISALICFTTAGRLWFVPGPLLLVAGVMVVRGADRTELVNSFDERRWQSGLVALCGAYYVFLGATALGVSGLLGVVGGMLVWAALAAARRSRRAGFTLLFLGALPFAVATWWSVVTPLTAVLVLLLGRTALRHTPPQQPPPGGMLASSPASPLPLSQGAPLGGARPSVGADRKPG